ncbi:MAG: hypothetical protein H0W25_05355 [Acidimicrobiia bacterium]|nr:hypothetical protein [Acidimicrobiia bacterium]
MALGIAVLSIAGSGVGAYMRFDGYPDHVDVAQFLEKLSFVGLQVLLGLLERRLL